MQTEARLGRDLATAETQKADLATRLEVRCRALLRPPVEALVTPLPYGPSFVTPLCLTSPPSVPCVPLLLPSPACLSSFCSLRASPFRACAYALSGQAATAQLEAAQGQLREAQTRHREEAAKAKHSETLLLQVPEPSSPLLAPYLGLSSTDPVYPIIF